MPRICTVRAHSVRAAHSWGHGGLARPSIQVG